MSAWCPTSVGHLSRAWRVLCLDDDVVRRVLYSENVELTTDQKGAIAEACISATAVKLGLGVFRPVSDGERYDLILDLRPKLVRVQCKWASRHGDVVIVRCYSCRRARDGLLKRSYSSDEIDAIAAYCMELDRCFYFPVEWLRTRSTIQLRVGPSRNNQRALINWADEFAFERLKSENPGAIAQLGERVSGRDEVAGSSPAGSTDLLQLRLLDGSQRDRRKRADH